jgi:DmsE family decaheme c-type cytochrome
LQCLILMLFALPAMALETSEPAHGKRTPIYTTEGVESCLRCHAGNEMRAVQSSPHFNLENPGSPAARHGCESCHGPGSIHISRAHGGQGFPPLLRFGRGKDKAPRDQQLAACMQCHEIDSGGTIRFFGSPHDRNNINCSTCHTVHAADDPIGEREKQAATCYRCHRKAKTEHPRFEASSMNIDVLKCSDCHDVHRPMPE